MARQGAEPSGAMGTDTPLAVLSGQHPPLFNYFKQRFAQVTNPPIDAIREKIVTSTSVYVGAHGNLLEDKPENCKVLKVHNPILTDGPTWDCAAVSLRAIDQNGNLLPYCGEAVQLSVEGPLRILGPSVVPLRGGMAGTYLATTGEAGPARLRCRMEGALDTEASLTIRRREEERG